MVTSERPTDACDAFVSLVTGREATFVVNAFVPFVECRASDPSWFSSPCLRDSVATVIGASAKAFRPR